MSTPTGGVVGGGAGAVQVRVRVRVRVRAGLVKFGAATIMALVPEWL